MFAISTVYNAWRHAEAVPLVAELKSLGFTKLELGAFLPPQLVNDILPLVREGGIEVTSLHHPCPAPVFSRGIRRRLSLASRNEEMRSWAVKQALHTVDVAGIVGAGAVVLHLGEVPVGKSGGKIFGLAEADQQDGRAYKKLLEKVRKKREAKKALYLEQAVKSLSEIARHAEEKSIRVGIETRYYPWEIPSLEEFEFFLERVSSPALGYWHDIGHARVRENLGWDESGEYLKRYGETLIGMHIHDVICTRDHQPPLQGDIDFEEIGEFLRKDIIKVLEIHPTATTEAIKKALAYLTELERRT